MNPSTLHLLRFDFFDFDQFQTFVRDFSSSYSKQSFVKRKNIFAQESRGGILTYLNNNNNNIFVVFQWLLLWGRTYIMCYCGKHCY